MGVGVEVRNGAARDRDLDDLRVLWPHAGFASAEDAVEAFWQAYPHAPDDPFLINFVIDIAGIDASGQTGHVGEFRDGPTR